MDLRIKEEALTTGKFTKYFFQLLIRKTLAHRFFRQIVRWLDWRLVRDSNFIEIFDKYQPALVFLAHIFGDQETSILRQARKRSIKTVGLINSWDKITSRCMIRLLPDKMIVHNDIVRKEALRHADMSEENIEVVGVPNYDIYANSSPTSKEEFYKKIGADVGQRLLVFCPLGKRYNDMDAEMINIISDFKVKNLIPEDTQIIVRFPPNDIVDVAGIRNKEHLIFVQPGTRFTTGHERRMDWDMNSDDIQFLLDSLFYTSVMVCKTSSMSVDTAIFDKPIINFRLKSETGVKPPRDGDWLYDLNHYQPILNSGGVRVVQTKDELLRWINKYLENPQLDAAGRKRIVQEQCWKLDGQAGTRTAKFILSTLGY